MRHILSSDKQTGYNLFDAFEEAKRGILDLLRVKITGLPPLLGFPGPVAAEA
jgi:hypothetical protein